MNAELRAERTRELKERLVSASDCYRCQQNILKILDQFENRMAVDSESSAGKIQVMGILRYGAGMTVEGTQCPEAWSLGRLPAARARY